MKKDVEIPEETEEFLWQFAQDMMKFRGGLAKSDEAYAVLFGASLERFVAEQTKFVKVLLGAYNELGREKWKSIIMGNTDDENPCFSSKTRSALLKGVPEGDEEMLHFIASNFPSSPWYNALEDRGGYSCEYYEAMWDKVPDDEPVSEEV